jgi:site-specific recombinase XerD
MQFSEAIAMYLRHLEAKRRSSSTITWYQEQFIAFERWRLAARVGDELPTAERIDLFLADQHAAGLRPSTVHARYRAIRAVLRFLEKRRRLRHDDNPIHLLEAPTVPVETRRYVTPDDLERIIGAIDGQSWLDHRDRLILAILFFSGLRVTELCDLAVTDIDAARLEVIVRSGKGEKARVVPTAPEVRQFLAAYLYSRPNHTEHLLLKSDGWDGHAGPLKREGVRQMLIRRCRVAGIAPPFSPHAFRHGFAMWLINSGVRLTTVSTAMGHSDPHITHQIYAHTTATTVRREYDEARLALGRSRNR